MAGYKNSPTGVLNDDKGRVSVSRHWHDLSHKRITSLPFGKVVPILSEFLQGNTKVKLDTKYALQTNPTVSPVFSRVDITTTAILCPIRLYVHGLYGNNYEEIDLIEGLNLPTFTTSFDPGLGGAVLPGSLLARLQYPRVAILPVTGDVDHKLCTIYERSLTQMSGVQLSSFDLFNEYNCLSVLAYYDACRYYYADAYDRNLPFELSFVSREADHYRLQRQEYFIDADKLVKGVFSFRFVENLHLPLDDAWTIASAIDNNGYLNSWLPGLIPGLESNVDNFRDFPVDHLTCHDGLFPCTFKPDYLTAFYDVDEVEKLVVTTAGNIQSIRLAQADFNLKASILTRGKRYSDYNEVMTGAELSLSDHPIFCGSDRITVAFQDIVSTASTSNQPLGTPVARGYGKSYDTPRIEFTTQEASVLLVLAQAVPEVAHKSAFPRHHRYMQFGDIPNRFYDATGFQDLQGQDINFTGIEALDLLSVGSQPFFMESMVKYDVVDGVLATSGYKSYTFTRQFDYSLIGQGEIDAFVDIEYGKYFSTGDYEYVFPAYAPLSAEGLSQAPQLDNIFLLADFDFRVYQPLTNQVITTNSI